jgi:hypothetical protein
VLISPPAIGLSKITIPASVGNPVTNSAGSFTPGGAMSNDGIANLFFTNGSPAGSVALKYVGGGGTGMALVAGLPVTIVGAIWTNLGVTIGDPTKTAISINLIMNEVPTNLLYIHIIYTFYHDWERVVDCNQIIQT